MPGRLLIIDDERRHLEITRHFLTEAGYKVGAFWNPKEALEIALAEPFDLLVVDIFQPGIDGFEIARKLQDIPGVKGKPVLFVSARLQVPAFVMESMKIPTGFLEKPFTRDQLLAKIREMLAASTAA